MKFAIRQLLKSPGFAIVSLVTLALGIGVNTTAFTILNRLLLQGLPYPEPGRLVKVYRTGPQGNDMGQSPGDFFDGTEIDEMLMLRILSLSDDEKRSMAAVDERARTLLQRTESLTSEQMLGLHGTVRGLQFVGAETGHE